jgi:protein SCO1/2
MKLRYAILAISSVCLALVGAIVFGWYQTEYPSADKQARASIGGPFALVDGDGHAVTDRDYRGKWLVVYFGFTFCPDACPTALNTIAEALDALGPDAARVQPLFITIDPERDTPPVMKQYVAAFDSRIIGLTGTPQQIAAVAKAYRTYYQRVGDGPDYTMDHSTGIYLVDPDGRFNSLLPHDLSGQEMAKRLKELL